MIKRLQIDLIARQPLLLMSPGNEPNTVSSFNFIPGRVVLGVFANMWLRKNPGIKEAHRDDTFRQLFLGLGNIRFHDSYPTLKIVDKDLMSQALPSSYRVKKSEPAMLISFLDHEPEVGQQYIRDSRIGVIEDNTFTPIVHLFRDSFHHKRDRSLGTSEKGMIFHYNALAAGTSFRMEIDGEPAELQVIQDLLKGSKSIWAGRSRSAEYGRLDILNITPPQDPEFDVVEEDQDEINLYCRSHWVPSAQSTGVDHYSISEVEKCFGELWDIKGIFGTQLPIYTYQAVKAQRNQTRNALSAGTVLSLKRKNDVPGTKAANVINSLLLGGHGWNKHAGSGRFELLKLASVLHVNEPDQRIPKPPGKPPALLVDIIKSRVEHSLTAKVIFERELSSNHRLNGSLLGRMVQVLRAVDCDLDRFTKQLDDFKPEAKIKLTGSFVGNNSILEFFNKFPKIIRNELRDLTFPLNEEFKLENDESFLRKTASSLLMELLFSWQKQVRLERELKGEKS